MVVISLATACIQQSQENCSHENEKTLLCPCSPPVATNGFLAFVAAFSCRCDFLVPLDMARRNARSDPPPTEGVQCVLNIPSYFLSYFLPNFSYIQPASYISYILGLLPPSLFLSPRGRAFRKADPKIGQCNHVGFFFAIFWPSKALLEKCFEKPSKKVRKSRILASQNLPKTLPKSIQNRCPKKHAIFHRFLLETCFVATVPTSIFYWFLQWFLLVGHFSLNRFLHEFSVQKTYQKPFQNEARTPPKSMLKMCCFSTSIF